VLGDKPAVEVLTAPMSRSRPLAASTSLSASSDEHDATSRPNAQNADTKRREQVLKFNMAGKDSWRRARCGGPSEFRDMACLNRYRPIYEVANLAANRLTNPA
jgi:hypothetical protein